MSYQPSRKNLRKPRKTNTAAHRLIAAGEVLWDRRAVTRAATKHRLNEQERVAAQPRDLEADHRRAVLELTPDWDWSNGHWSGTDFDQLAEALIATAEMAGPQRRMLTIMVDLQQGFDFSAIKTTLRQRAPQARYLIRGATRKTRR